MGLRSGGRKLSFDILSSVPNLDVDDDTFLYKSNSDVAVHENGVAATLSKSNRRKRKNKKGSKENRSKSMESSISEDTVTADSEFYFGLNMDNNSITANGELKLDSKNYAVSSTVLYEELVMVPEESESWSTAVCTISSVTGAVPPTPKLLDSHAGELRQRSVPNGGVVEGDNVKEDAVSRIEDKVKEAGANKEFDLSSGKQQRLELNNGYVGGKLQKEESLDWNRLMAEDPNYAISAGKSPVKYFMEEMYKGNALCSTTTLGDEKERERVYDTIFRLPWRCELLIVVGFFVCLDSFLSLFTIMPSRLVLTFWKVMKTRQFKRPSAAELSDFGCFLVLACGVALLQQADISLIYHMIRGQGTIKLYVVYNVLEICDKLCQSFGGEMMQTLFNSAEGLSSCSPENMRYWILRFISDEALAVGSSIVHSFILLAQAITLSTCIVSHNNALFALLVSNNFAEIKSNVFKRFSKENIHSIVYSDSVEMFHISAFLLFVLAQNILEAEGAWFESFLFNALVVYICEMMIDVIKHSFIAKFNDLKPVAFSEFLEDLCKQTLNMRTESGKKSLTFVPLAPACVVIRVLHPVYSAHLPHGPIPWSFFWIFLLSVMTFVMLSSLKLMIGMGLQKHATWYINRCRKRKLHSD